MASGKGAGAGTGVGRARETTSMASRHIVRDVTHAGIAGRLGGGRVQILLGEKVHPGLEKDLLLVRCRILRSRFYWNSKG